MVKVVNVRKVSMPREMNVSNVIVDVVSVRKENVLLVRMIRRNQRVMASVVVRLVTMISMVLVLNVEMIVAIVIKPNV
jgi:hypothetical protein